MNTNRPNGIFSWLPDDDRLNPFYQGIVEFVDKYINAKDIGSNTKIKEIIDPCVGYIKIYSWEMALLDTLLFQRLRKITQLGLAYLVYPTLTYSRFEHTIGVLGRLNQVLTRLKEKHSTFESKYNDSSFTNIIDKYETYIRLAALFHDVGHCLFSHLSESVISKLSGQNNYPSTQEIRDIFNEKFSRQNTSLSIFEIFSITILGTFKVANVLVKNNIKLNLKKDDKNIRKEIDLKDDLYNVSRLIAGVPILDQPDTVFLAQLMNSGLDVDKLDYMSREELFSGIKIEMDLQRIFNKIKLIKISTYNLPDSLLKYTKHLKKDVTKSFIVLGIEKGGQFSYEEFCMARLALYEKIYLHKKVRAAESFLKQKLRKLVNYETKFNCAHEWLYLPESIIEKNLYTLLESKFKNQGKLFHFDDKIRLKLDDIKDRKIPHRAFGFGPANSKTDDPTKNEQGDILSDDQLMEISSIKLWNDLKNDEKKEGFTELVINEAKRISSEILVKLKSINEDEKIKLIENDDDEQKVRDTLVIDIPNYSKVQLDPQTLHFEDAGYQTINWTIPIDRISSYYKLHRILAYVYVHYDYCPLLYLAIERVLYNFNNKNYIFDQIHSVSERMYGKANKIKQYLINISYYDDFSDIVPLNEELNSAYTREKVNQVISNLSGIECLVNRKLSYLNIEKFIRQFDREIQLPLLQLISLIKVLDVKKELYNPIKEVCEQIRNNGSNSKIGLLPLGSYMNSSSNILKSLNPIIKENNIKHLTINSDLNDISHILLIDDNINTGIQCLNIMTRLLNIDLRVLKENNVYLNLEGNGEFDKPNNIKRFAEQLKSKEIIFFFVSGYEDSGTKLSEFLKKYCDLDLRKIQIKIVNKLNNHDKLFSGKFVSDSKSIFRETKDKFKDLCSDEQREKLYEFLRDVGEQLVKNEGIVKLYKQKPEDNSLGYANRESLVIFANSIPTMTLTALWCHGKYNNVDWIPLIPRDYTIN